MAKAELLGLILSSLISLPCIWHGQLMVNPSARLLLVPAAVQEALR